jgi:hypothetical protein
MYPLRCDMTVGFEGLWRTRGFAPTVLFHCQLSIDKSFSRMVDTLRMFVCPFFAEAFFFGLLVNV